MAEQWDADEAREHLEVLVERAEAGEEFVILRQGRPVARLIGEAATESRAGVAVMRADAI